MNYLVFAFFAVCLVAIVHQGEAANGACLTECTPFAGCSKIKTYLDCLKKECEGDDSTAAKTTISAVQTAYDLCVAAIVHQGEAANGICLTECTPSLTGCSKIKTYLDCLKKECEGDDSTAAKTTISTVQTAYDLCADIDCKTGIECSGSGSCQVGGTRYCCPGGRVSVKSTGGELTSCSCTYGSTGISCSTTSSSSNLTSGAACSTGEACRSETSCKTGGTVYCCVVGGRLVVNGTDQTCFCDAGSGLECSGRFQAGLGSQLLPPKPDDKDCRSGSECSSSGSCPVGGTRYCCPGGRVSAKTTGGELTSCSCTYGSTGSSCSTTSSSSNLASGLTCVMAPILAVSFRLFSQLRG